MADTTTTILPILGKTLNAVEGCEDGSDEVTFRCVDGSVYRMYHEQDCCESVDLNEIIGDVADLIGPPLTMAEVVASESDNDNTGGTSTWTFYKFATAKGYVTLRWLGSSNGYYSESVTFERSEEATP